MELQAPPGFRLRELSKEEVEAQQKRVALYQLREALKLCTLAGINAQEYVEEINKTL